MSAWIEPVDARERARAPGAARARRMPTTWCRPPPTASCGACGTPACPRPDDVPAYIDDGAAQAANGAGPGLRGAPARRRPHRRLHALRPCRRGQPARGDRLDLVRRRRPAQRGQHGLQAAAAGHAFETLQLHRGGAAHAPAQPPLARRHRAPRRAGWTACCATTASCPMAAIAIPWCIRSSTSEWPAVRRHLDHQLERTLHEPTRGPRRRARPYRRRTDPPDPGPSATWNWPSCPRASWTAQRVDEHMRGLRRATLSSRTWTPQAVAARGCRRGRPGAAQRRQHEPSSRPSTHAARTPWWSTCPPITASTRWYYGLPELTRERYRGEKRISNPGCYATAIQLAVAPLKDLLTGPPVVLRRVRLFRCRHHAV